MAYSHKRLKKRVYIRDDFTCQYCGEDYYERYMAWKAGKTRRKYVGLEVDHIIPVSKGGKWEITNLVACCTQCNRAKRDKLPNEVIHN